MNTTLRRWWLGSVLTLGLLGVSSEAHAQLAGGGGGAGAGGGFGGGGGGGGGGGTTGFASGAPSSNVVSASFAGGSASFAGGQAGSFSGGLSFSGGAANAGGGAAGAAGAGGAAGRIGGAGAAGGGVLVPSTMNPFATTYKNFRGLGMYQIGGTAAPTTSSVGYGAPLYGQVGAAGPSGALGGRGGAAGGRAGAGALGGNLGGGNLGGGSTGNFSTTGTYRAPPYMTVLHEDIAFVRHAAPVLKTDISGFLDSSAYLKKVNNLDVNVDGNAVTLRGEVGSERERRLVEGTVRLTPGVRAVNNQLTIREK